MKQLSIIVSCLLLLGGNLQAQDLRGEYLHELGDPYETHTFRLWFGDNLTRAYARDTSGEEALTHYLYVDTTGLILIQLPDSLYFPGVEPFPCYPCPDYGNGLVSDFSDGMAVVFQKESYLAGYIDTTGAVVIPPQYTLAGRFSEGLAYVADVSPCYVGEAYPATVSYIDKNNEPVFSLPPKLTTLYGCCYFSGEPFDQGVAWMQISEYGADCNCHVSIKVNREGKILETKGQLYDVDNQPVSID